MSKYCWYSQADDLIRGHYIYQINGKEYKVTNVAKELGVSNSFNSSDVIYLDKAEKLVKINAKIKE